MEKKKAKKEEKKKVSNKMIIGMIILGLLIAIVVGIILFNHSSQKEPSIDDKSEDEIEYNTNTGVVEDKIVNNVLFSNIECSFDGNYSLLTYKVTNNSKETLMLGDYEIIVKDKDGNILTNIVLSITEELEPNQSIDTGNSIDIDLRDAYQIELVNDVD